MEFFDKLTKKATETYKGAAEKTSKLAKETKLKMKISDNKSKIDELYKKKKKKVYQKHVSKDENCIKDQIAEELLKIDNLSSEELELLFEQYRGGFIVQEGYPQVINMVIVFQKVHIQIHIC